MDTEIELPQIRICEICDGTGKKPGTNKESCPTCQGTGQKKVIRKTPYGEVPGFIICTTCYGEGEIIKHPCKKCNGAGKLKKKAKIDLKIPEGVSDGGRLRINGEGNESFMGGPPGDLYVVFHVKPHDIS